MRTVLIIVSLALNGLLLAALAAPQPVRRAYYGIVSMDTKTARAPGGATRGTDPDGGAAAEKRGAASAAMAAQPAQTWGALDTADPRALAERLRGTGMPPQLIRALVAAKLDREIAARRAALRAATPQPAYWNELARANPRIDFRAEADLRQAERQKLALLDAALGPETALAERNDPRGRLKYGDLPADKARQARVLDEDYDELLARVTDGMLRVIVPGDREALARLRAEKETDLRAALSPAEYEAYLLRTSPTAEKLRASLATFAPTAEEFRAIFALQRAYDEKYPFPWLAYSPGVASSEEFAQRQQDGTNLATQIRAALGPERGAEYERESNYSFRQLAQAVTQLGLEKAAAVQAWTVQQEFNRRAAALRADRTLRPADATARIEGMRAELTERLYAALGGQRGLEAYNRAPLGGAVRPLAAPVAVGRP